MNHNINEIQLPNAKEAADREEYNFRPFVEYWANMTDENIKLYPPFIQQILAHRREVSKRYLKCENKEKESLKSDLVYTNSLIKDNLVLL